MKKIILILAGVVLCLTAMAQAQVSRTMRVFYGGEVVYSRDVTQIDSVDFLKEGGDEELNAYSENLGNDVLMKMNPVEGGTFSMGATEDQGSDSDWDAKPVHSVTLDGFYIGATEVTQAQWKAVMGTEPVPSTSGYGVGDDYPVYRVSWSDAVAFCDSLSKKTGKKYRLPTEAEWEYAARGGANPDGTKYAGSNDMGSVGWYTGNNTGSSHPVAQKKPNGLGLYDMSGNLWEWCSDWYGVYSASAAVNPQGPESGERRVNRGGSWDYGALGCTVSYRGMDKPGETFSIVGFRVVCEL